MKFLIQRTKVFFTNQSPLESTASLLVTALVFLLPIFFVPGLALPLQFTKSVLVALVVFLGLIFYIISQLKKRQVDISFNSVLITLWLIPGAYLVSTIFSGNVKLSTFGSNLNIDTLSFVVLMTVVASLVVALVQSQSRIIQIYLALFTSFGVLGLLHILRLAFGVDFLSFAVLNTATSTPIGSWNDLAIFSGLIAILSLIVLTTNVVSRRAAHMFKGSLAVSLFFILLINFSTVWWVVGLFALAMFIYSIVSGNKVEGENAQISITSLVVLVIAVSVLFFGSGMGVFFANKFNTEFFDVRPSWESTIDIGKSVYSENALFGSGPNTFEKDWALNKPAEINDTIFWNVDFNTGIGYVPTSLITTGLLGMVAWLAFFLAFLLAGFKSLILRPDEDVFVYRITLASFLSALYLWTLSVLSSPSASIVGLAFVFTGMFIASLRKRNTRLSISFVDNPRLGFIAVFMLTIVFLGSVAGLFTLSQKYFAAISHDRGASLIVSDLPLAIEKLGNAISLDKNDQYYRSLTEAHLTELNILLSESDSPSDDLQARFQRIVGDAVTSAQAGLEIDNKNYQNWLQLGRIYQMLVPLQIDGTYDNAIDAYKEALANSPEDPSIYLRIAEIEFIEGNNESGKKYIKQALDKKGNYSAAVFTLAQVQLEEGNIKEAITSAEALTLIDPNNATAYFQLGLLKYNSGDNDGAISSLTRAINISSTYSNARYFLGLAYHKDGRLVDSLEQFEEVQKTNPDNEDITAIIDNLKAGKSPIGEEVEDIPISGE